MKLMSWKEASTNSLMFCSKKFFDVEEEKNKELILRWWRNIGNYNFCLSMLMNQMWFQFELASQEFYILMFPLDARLIGIYPRLVC
jgi:hypothetical protein